MIQENMKVFEKELYILKREQNSVTSSDNNFFNLLISEININIIFFILSDEFWINLDIKENFLISAESFQDIQ